MFSDLECDYINPIDLCNKLNQVKLLNLNSVCPSGICSSSFIMDFVFVDWELVSSPVKHAIGFVSCKQVFYKFKL